MKSWRNAFTILAILAIWTSGTAILEGQVTDTITVTIQGKLTTAILTGEYVTPFQAGDTAIFRVELLDEAGDPIAGHVTWYSSDSTALRLEELPINPDLPGNMAEIRGVALKKATVRVWVMAEPILEIHLASFRPHLDSLNWSGHDSIYIWRDSTGAVVKYDSLQYCAYATRGGYLVVESPGPPTCPVVFVPPPTQESLDWFPRIVRAVPSEEFRRLARGVRGAPGKD